MISNFLEIRDKKDNGFAFLDIVQKPQGRGDVRTFARFIGCEDFAYEAHHRDPQSG
jgi:hypothetical protein